MPWFEDVRVGATIELGAHTFTSEEIVRFARAFDPQPFHLDPEAAAASHFGGLVASGWHTAAVWMKLRVAQLAARAAERGINEPLEAFGPSPGFQDLRWLRPVRAGDTIRYTTRAADKRALATRPQWGLVTSRNEGFNQRGELAFAFTGHVFVRLRTVD
jgi:acyl dehydratase